MADTEQPLGKVKTVRSCRACEGRGWCHPACGVVGCFKVTCDCTAGHSNRDPKEARITAVLGNDGKLKYFKFIREVGKQGAIKEDKFNITRVTGPRKTSGDVGFRPVVYKGEWILLRLSGSGQKIADRFFKFDTDKPSFWNYIVSDNWKNKYNSCWKYPYKTRKYPYTMKQGMQEILDTEAHTSM